MPLPIIEPMLATNRVVDGDGWAVEPKLDGWRAIVYVDGSVRVRTRRGRDSTDSVPALAGLAKQLAGRQVVLDGELVAEAGRSEDFYRIGPRMAARRRPGAVCFVAFDVLHLDGADLTAEPYIVRRAELERLALRGDAWTTTLSLTVDLDALRPLAEQHGLEGFVLKRRTSIYKPGARSRQWVKVKTSTWREGHAPLRHEQR